MRRPGNPARRHGGSGGKSTSSPLLVLFIVGALIVFFYYYGRSGDAQVKAIARIQGEVSCTAEVPRAVPILKEVYGGSMRKVLHVGPDTCLVVSELLKEDETEAWGLEPYDLEDADASCRALVHRGIVRLADIKFPLPYRPKSFSLVIVSDALDYLSPKYLNRTLPDLARISADGLVIFTGYPDKRKAKAAEVSKFGRAAKRRSSSWWAQYFQQNSLEENEAVAKTFTQAAKQRSYSPTCQIFHLKSYQ